MDLFVDTWGWIALGNPRDRGHRAASRQLAVVRQGHGIVVTTDYVLDETITLLFLRQPFPKAAAFFTGILEAAALGTVTIETISPERFAKAWILRKKYRDKPTISFTDFASFVVMQELNVAHVLTDDHHFEQAGLDFIRIC